MSSALLHPQPKINHDNHDNPDDHDDQGDRLAVLERPDRFEAE